MEPIRVKSKLKQGMLCSGSALWCDASPLPMTMQRSPLYHSQICSYYCLGQIWILPWVFPYLWKVCQATAYLLMLEEKRPPLFTLVKAIKLCESSQTWASESE